MTICLRPFDGSEGIELEGDEVIFYRGGVEVGRRQGGAAGELPSTGSLLGLARAAVLLEAERFCYVAPLSFAGVTARIDYAGSSADLAGLGLSPAMFYERSYFESFEGELYLYPRSDGETLRATFQERRHPVGNFARETPEARRRIVEISLPPELAAHEEDLVLLHRLAVVVAELVERYVEARAGAEVGAPGGAAATAGATAGTEDELVYTSAPLDNSFAGGGFPLPATVAPALAGRSVNNVYLSAHRTPASGEPSVGSGAADPAGKARAVFRGPSRGAGERRRHA